MAPSTHREHDCPTSDIALDVALSLAVFMRSTREPFELWAAPASSRAPSATSFGSSSEGCAFEAPTHGELPSLSHMTLSLDILLKYSSKGHLAVLALFIESLVSKAAIGVSRSNWQLLTLSAFQLASKNIDDDPISVSDMTLLAIMCEMQSSCPNQAITSKSTLFSAERFFTAEVALLKMLDWSTFTTAHQYWEQRKRLALRSAGILEQLVPALSDDDYAFVCDRCPSVARMPRRLSTDRVTAAATATAAATVTAAATATATPHRRRRSSSTSSAASSSSSSSSVSSASWRPRWMQRRHSREHEQPEHAAPSPLPAEGHGSKPTRPRTERAASDDGWGGLLAMAEQKAQRKVEKATGGGGGATDLECVGSPGVKLGGLSPTYAYGNVPHRRVRAHAAPTTVLTPPGRAEEHERASGLLADLDLSDLDRDIELASESSAAPSSVSSKASSKVSRMSSCSASNSSAASARQLEQQAEQQRAQQQAQQQAQLEQQQLDAWMCVLQQKQARHMQTLLCPLDDGTGVSPPTPPVAKRRTPTTPERAVLPPASHTSRNAFSFPASVSAVVAAVFAPLSEVQPMRASGDMPCMYIDATDVCLDLETHRW